MSKSISAECEWTWARSRLTQEEIKQLWKWMHVMTRLSYLAVVVAVVVRKARQPCFLWCYESSGNVTFAARSVKASAAFAPSDRP